MTESTKTVAQAFIRAINRQDADALASLLTEDHRSTDALGNVVEGRDKMCSAWAAYFRMVPDYTVAVEETFGDGSIVVLLGVAMGTYAPHGELKPENRWKTTVALRAVIEDGKVSEWKVYADNEPMRRLIAQPV